MARIEPVPEAEVNAGGWKRLQEAEAEGKTSETVFSRVLAYHSEIFAGHVEAVVNRRFDGMLGARLLELVRLRSAQLGGCQLCQAARYGDEVGDADIECMAIGGDTLDERERRALDFVRLMHIDHHAVDDEVYRSLHEVFSTAEIIELGMTTAALLGVHRWLHTLDLAGTASPAIRFDRAELR